MLAGKKLARSRGISSCSRDRLFFVRISAARQPVSMYNESSILAARGKYQRIQKYLDNQALNATRARSLFVMLLLSACPNSVRGAPSKRRVLASIS